MKPFRPITLAIALLLSVGFLELKAEPVAKTEKSSASEEKQATPKSSNPLELTSHSNGKTIPTTVGTLINVTLPGNVTTGYYWTVEDSEAIVQVGKADYVSQGLPGQMGAGGTYKFHFRVAKPGNSVLKMKYARNKGPAGNTFLINFQVAK